MKTFIKGSVLAAFIAILVGIGGNATEASAQETGYWYLANDGCAYFWDNLYGNTALACPRSDSGYDFSQASNGQWVYSFSAGYMTDGSTWLISGGQLYYIPASTGCDYSTCMSLGGGNGSGLTGNVVIDQIVIDANNAMINTILAPSCYEYYCS